jgi:hypothetical protein
MFSVWGTLVVSGIEVEAVTVHQRGRVAQVLVFYKGV